MRGERDEDKNSGEKKGKYMRETRDVKKRREKRREDRRVEINEGRTEEEI